VTSFVVTGQDAEKASVQYIIDGKQSMTVFKDVRTLVADAIDASEFTGLPITRSNVFTRIVVVNPSLFL
jgi:hypothetical protein